MKSVGKNARIRAVRRRSVVRVVGVEVGDDGGGIKLADWVGIYDTWRWRHRLSSDDLGAYCCF
jgi:hypothetical protein